MKKFFQSYATFNRTERIGLISLCAVMLILFAIRASMPWWVHKTNGAENDKKLVAAWAAFKARINVDTSKRTDKEDPIVRVEYINYDNQNKQDERPPRTILDANTVDSAALSQITGIDAATASVIIADRKANGPFTNINQLAQIEGVSKASFRILEKRLVIAQ